jgi:hydroxysqualene dehydroxylase
VDRDAHALAAALSGAKSLAVVGGGWAGLAAAVRAVERGHRVTLFEMAPRLGGRAREVLHEGVALDNGQHILIGAYTETLALISTVGADPDALLLRSPLSLVDPHGRGLALPAGPAVPAFVRAVLALRDWTLGERMALLSAALRWRLSGFRAAPDATVAHLARTLPERALRSLVEPLCVAALNTPAERASAQVFLRVLHDALFAGPGAADLLLPRVSLSALMPEPAAAWLAARGARAITGRRVERVAPAGAAQWLVDDETFDAVLLACSANEAARLARGAAPAWSEVAAAFDYEPIVTVYLKSRGTRWPRAMQMLPGGAPAQFGFDLGALERPGGARDGLFAFVASGAREWVARGLDATTSATLEQAQSAFPADAWRESPTLVKALAERRATFLCTPALQRPALQVAPGLAAAGDYVAGPYPATLEGAVRSARQALLTLGLS